MKTFKTSRALLVSSILTALAGCEIENPEYTPEAQANNSAPTHGGDIVLAYHEKDAFAQIDLLGTIAGVSAGDTAAKDADGNFLTVTDLVVSVSGDRVDDIAGAGIEVQGNKIGIRPLDMADNLDTGETYTVTLDFNVSDGQNETARMATLTFTGEDFAPVAVGDAVGNFIRDTAVGEVDLFTNVSDQDGETLAVHTVVADAGNALDIPYTLTDTGVLQFDIASVQDDIELGTKYELSYSYTISDHNHNIARNVNVVVLGVQAVDGAPVIANYFPVVSTDETSALQVYNLLPESISDPEGDDIVVSNIMVDGSADLPYGVSSDATAATVTVNPQAFLDLEAGAFRELAVTYNVADSNGNMSDGEVTYTVTVNGVETNLLAELGVDVGFEATGAGVTELLDSEGNGSCGAGTELTTTTVANGSAAFQMLGDPCYMAIPAANFPDLVEGGKYYFHYNLNVGAGDTSPYIMISNDHTDAGAHDFWQGARPWHPANGSWRPALIEYDTGAGFLATANGDGETPMDIADQLRLYFMSAWVAPNGMPVFDDLNFTRYDNIEGVNILTGAVEGVDFEDESMTLNTNSQGIMSIVEDPNNADNNVLMVNTTGATEAPTLTFDIPNGAIVPGGKYVVSYDVQYANYTANKDGGTDANINQWGGYRHVINISNGALNFEVFHTIWNGDGYANSSVVGDETSHWWGHGTDTSGQWDNDSITATIRFDGTGANYYIDNVKIHRIP